jgi:hypothetical protein
VRGSVRVGTLAVEIVVSTLATTITEITIVGAYQQTLITRILILVIGSATMVTTEVAIVVFIIMETTITTVA